MLQPLVRFWDRTHCIPFKGKGTGGHENTKVYYTIIYTCVIFETNILSDLQIEKSSFLCFLAIKESRFLLSHYVHDLLM